MLTTVSFTGHRPPKADLTWSHEAKYDGVAVGLVRDWLREFQPSLAIVGGAQGFDTLAARACYLEHIPYDAYVPFANQDERWPQEARTRYRAMLNCAREIRIIGVSTAIYWAFDARNRAMVDDSDHTLAWWDGSTGGTANCLNYCLTTEQPFTNLYPKGPSSQ